MVPPPDNPWAGKDWDELAPISSASFDRIRRSDFNRLRLYAVGRKALATDTAGATLHPEAEGEVEKSYGALTADVKRLHREICSLNKRAAPSGSVDEGQQAVTTIMMAYSSTPVHAVEMQIAWYSAEVRGKEGGTCCTRLPACQQLLRGHDGGGAPMDERVASDEIFGSATGSQGRS
jgi:hypothetical protein